MLVFPEGKRNKGRDLLPFKTGAFQLSRDFDAKILPICISGAKSLFVDGSMTPKRGHIHLKILQPMSILENETIEDFSNRVKAVLSNEKALLEK